MKVLYTNTDVKFSTKIFKHSKTDTVGLRNCFIVAVFQNSNREVAVIQYVQIGCEIFFSNQIMRLYG